MLDQKPSGETLEILRMLAHEGRKPSELLAYVAEREDLAGCSLSMEEAFYNSSLEIYLQAWDDGRLLIADILYSRLERTRELWERI